MAVAVAVTGAVSLAWLTAVSLAPSSGRPYVDGSRHDSAYEQVFGYNGFGRFGDQTPLQQLQWIAAHCRKLPFSAGALDNYYCTPADAG